MSRPFTTIIFSLLITGCSAPKALTKKQAIHKAQNYILIQGYTSDTTKIDSMNIDHDLAEGIMSLEGILKMRYNTLNPKSKFQKRSFGTWAILFQGTQDTTSFTMVKINRNGSKIRMEHQNYSETDL
jgi:hypothetical protein